MKILSPLSNLPELREVKESERFGVIKQWQSRVMNQSWRGWLLFISFLLLLGPAISTLPISLLAGHMAPEVRNWVVPFFVPFGLGLGNILYQRLILTRTENRDLLQRILEQRRNAL